MLPKIKQFVKPSREISNNNIKSGKACSKFFYWVKEHLDDIILVIGVILISLLSFAAGYIVAKQQDKEPIRIEYRDTNILMHTNDTNVEISIISSNSYISIDSCA